MSSKIDKVFIYLEGRSDTSAMEVLLKPLLDRKKQEGVIIRFFESIKGHKKETLVMKNPKKAVNIIRNNPNTAVVIMPDLHPKNKGFPHETYQEMKKALEKL